MNKRSMGLLLISNATASIGTGVSMIAIPWLLVSQAGGSFLFSSVAMAVNIALFLATPLIGPVIDMGSRHALMIWLRLAFIFGLLLALFAYLSLNDEKIALVLYYVLGNTFYAINIPLRSAYVQETFSGGEYLRVNAILEIENQVAAALTGLIAIFAIKQFGFVWLTISNISMYVLAIVCLVFIPYKKLEIYYNKSSYLLSLKDGFIIAYQKPKITLMLMLASIPYVIVILFTVLHPIAINKLGDRTGSIYALIELIFSIGAICGGLSLSYINKYIEDSSKFLMYSIFIFSLIIALQSIFPTYSGFIILSFGIGLCNATSRVLRQSFLMREFHQRESGRISSFLQSMIMLKRAIFTSILTLILSNGDISYALYYMTIISIFSSISFYIIRKQWITKSLSYSSAAE